MQLKGDSTPKRLAARVLRNLVMSASGLSTAEVSAAVGEQVNDAQAAKVREAAGKISASFVARIEKIIG